MRGRTPDSGVITASARIAGIYAKPEGRSGTRIGSVAVPEGTAPDLTALAATFVDATGDYDLATVRPACRLKNGNYEIPYTRYTAPSLDARITYDKAEDTEFSFDAYGNLTVHSGPDAEWVGDTTLNLYDTKRDVTITKQVTERSRAPGRPRCAHGAQHPADRRRRAHCSGRLAEFVRHPVHHLPAERKRATAGISNPPASRRKSAALTAAGRHSPTAVPPGGFFLCPHRQTLPKGLNPGRFWFV